MTDFMTELPRRFHARDKISPQFTRRHYIWLTNAMRQLLSNFTVPDKDNVWKSDAEEISSHQTDYWAVQRGIEIFAEILANDNPRFNKEQFLHNILNPTSEPK
jgi:hypothetical protein